MTRLRWIVIAVLLACSAAGACPNCKDAISRQPGGTIGSTPLARSYFYSIVAMVGMPFVIVGSAALYLYRRDSAEC